MVEEPIILLGPITITIPTKPINTATQLVEVTFSFNIRGARIVVINGETNNIIVASAKAYISALNRLIFKKSKSIVNKSAEIKIEGV